MDPTETIRRAMIAAGDALDPEFVSAARIWDTSQLGADFEVIGFLAPFVTVRRRADGKVGSMKFVHHPRLYYGWEES
jgi:hypothetical protein